MVGIGIADKATLDLIKTDTTTLKTNETSIISKIDAVKADTASILASGGYTPDFINLLMSINDGSNGNYVPGASGNLAAGVYKYNTVNIPAGVTISASSSPLIILAKTSITIAGALSANAIGAAGGAFAWNAVPGSNGRGNCGAGGAGGFSRVSGVGPRPGGVGGDTIDLWGAIVNKGGIPANQDGVVSGAGGTNKAFFNLLLDNLNWCGAGGGTGDQAGGGTGSAPNSVGGSGGGLIILVSPIINITGSVTANGQNGYNAGNTTTASGGGGGGGGGGVIIFAKTLTTTGTISANGGTGGIGTTVSAFVGGTGGAGGAGFVLKGGL